MRKKLNSALILESKGRFLEAMRLYTEILQADSTNRIALRAKNRLDEKISANADKLRLFMSTDRRENLEFERWLVDL